MNNEKVIDTGDQQQQELGWDCTGTSATWASAFDASVWINSLYYTASDDKHCTNDNNTDTTATAKTAAISSDFDLVCGDGAEEDVYHANEQKQKQRESDEVLGWSLDSFARGVVVISIACFVSTELLRLAKEAAACPDDYYAEPTDDDLWEMVECDARVFGIKPSSLLTNLVMCTSLISAFIMPLIGSIIDHTRHRKMVASVSAAAMVLLIFVQMLVMEQFWYIAALLQIFIAFSYQVHLCAVYAYLPELTQDHEVLATYTSRFVAVQYCGSVSLLVLMIVILSTINKNEQFNVVTLSNSTVFIICGSLWGYSWLRLFRKRPPRQLVPPGRTLLVAGFWKIYKTGRTILREHNAIKWCLVAASFTNAALVTFSTIAITYLTDQLEFGSKENGICILLLLVFGFPGTRLAMWVTNRYNPLRSYQVCLIVWIINTTLCACFCYDPTRKGLAYCFSMIWGIAIGWIYPTEKTLYVTIIPKGQEAELMGTYICSGSVLAWLPPLIFTIMNESGISMRIGLFSLTFYYMASFAALYMIGDHAEAVRHAKEIDEGQLEFAKAPSSGLIAGCYEQWEDEDAADAPLVDVCNNSVDVCNNSILPNLSIEQIQSDYIELPAASSSSSAKIEKDKS